MKNKLYIVLESRTTIIFKTFDYIICKSKEFNEKALRTNQRIQNKP